ncbi:MAG: phosphopantothenoylcysteine decarboxylase [Balneolaceae bacterium]|nr:phosphopantothenoylcysteine decarboxylase [Balneolaceae bacterium]
MLVTAGPTREFIDAVRFISNPSSGRMGFAMAEAARDLGAEVTLLHGPVSLDPPVGVSTRTFTSAAELFEEVKEHAGHDVVIMAAAVSDFSPASPEEGKIKKDKASPSLELLPTDDVLAWLGENRLEGQTLIGFAMETEKLVENASVKLRKKKADYIVGNALNEEGAGFGSETNRVVLLSGKEERAFEGTKKEVAHRVLKHIFGRNGD